MSQHNSEESVIATWVIILFLSFLFLLYTLFAYKHVGDKGPPGWKYGTVADVPGDSPHAIYKTLPYPQHVRGEKGE